MSTGTDKCTTEAAYPRKDIPSVQEGFEAQAQTGSCAESLGRGSTVHQPSFDLGQQSGYETGWKHGIESSRDAADRIFIHRQPTESQRVHLEAVQEAAKQFLRTLLKHTPHCADRAAAVRKIREAVMTVNFAIVSDGLDVR